MNALDLKDQAPVEQAAAWCLRLAEGALTQPEQSSFDRWLEADAAHRDAFDDAIRAWRAVEQAGSTPELVGMRTAALTAFRRGQRARWMSPALRRPWLIGGIAASLAAFALGIGVWIQALPHAYQTAIGERRVVVLADGSAVSLDADTKVEVKFDGKRRLIRLDQGRAKFTVARNPARPFMVAAADKTIVATGTAFSVELIQGQVHVILYQGHVAVLTDHGRVAGLGHVILAKGAGVADAALVPGTELTAETGADQAELAPVESARTLSWEGGQLVFVDEPLSSAVARVNRYSNEKLRVGDAAAGRQQISGVFTAGDTGAFVEGATGVLPVALVEEQGQQVLVSKTRSPQSQ